MLNTRKRVPWEPQVQLHLSGTDSEPYPCTLRGLFKGTLHVVSERPITTSADLTVSFGAATVAGTVQYCKPKGSSYLISVLVSSPPEIRRRTPRLPFNRTCSLMALGHTRSVMLTALITDISDTGMGIELPELLNVGTMLCVETDDFVAAGRLLHSRRLDDGLFAAGMEITDFLWGEKVSPPSWSRKARNWLKWVRQLGNAWIKVAFKRFSVRLVR